MILTTHALVGAAIGKNIATPWLIIPVSLAAHYVLDVLPHGEYLNDKSTFKDTAWKVALDLLLGFSIVVFYISYSGSGQAQITNIAIGAFFSLFPDLLTLLYWNIRLRSLKKLYDFHKWIHTRIVQEFLPWNFKNIRNDVIASFLAILFLLV